jgi:hypothetical protein
VALGAIFTFFGLMHSAYIGVGMGLDIALSYLAVSVFLFVCSRLKMEVTTEVVVHHDG